MSKRNVSRVPQNNALVAIIADEETVTGYLLAGIGNIDNKRNSNFLVVDNKTSKSAIEESFKKFTNRADIAVVIISQHIADVIRPLIDNFVQSVPSLLEVPSKDHKYDPERDLMMVRIKRMFGQT